MNIKNNILAFLLIGLVIVLTPYYLTLFEPQTLDEPSDINASEKKSPIAASVYSSEIITSNSIISLDETSIQPAMIPEYSHCNLCNIYIVKTDDSYLS